MQELKILHARVLNIYTLPKRIGAYVITHTYDNVHAERYVGATKNIYGRMTTHYSNKNIIYIDIYVTDDIPLAESLERILIELINPLTNIQIPSLSNKDKEIMKELMLNNKLNKYISENVVKIGCRYLNYITNDKVEYEKYKSEKEKKGTTVFLEQKTYSMILEKQMEIFKETNKRVPIQELVSDSIISGINLINKCNKSDFIHAMYEMYEKSLNEIKNGEDYIDDVELDGKKIIRQDDGSIKIIEGYEHIGDKIIIKKEELNDVIKFFVNVMILNNKDLEKNRHIRIRDWINL